MASVNPDERRVAVIADTPGGLDTLVDLASDIGLGVLFAADSETGIARMRDGFGGDGVLVDIADAHGANLTRLLSTLSDFAESRNTPVLVIA